MVIVEIGLRAAIKYGHIDASRGSSCLARSDNAGIVTVTNKGCLRSRETNKILKHVYLLQAQLGICVKTVYVTSKENVADALS